MRKVVIADTSYLIIFDSIDSLEILEKSYDEIITTPEVADEFGKSLPRWIKIESVVDKKYQKLIEDQLDIGESSAIVLAVEKKNITVILDDLKARKLARQLGLRITGTLGIISRAKEIGVINKVKPFVEKLKKSNFWISEELIDNFLKRNQE